MSVGVRHDGPYVLFCVRTALLFARLKRSTYALIRLEPALKPLPNRASIWVIRSPNNEPGVMSELGL